MILKRFYDEKLAHASYLVGCGTTGEAVVIDPNRDVGQYIDAASIEGLRITAVTETHIHADYLSGSRELADHTGARLYLSDEGDANWKYGFASQPNVTLVRDGDTFRIGSLSFEVVKTPGHTPEHIAFVLTDEPASSDPQAAFTGDFIFVGDVGRPDLLERAAGFQGTMEEGARTLFRSLANFKAKMPDSLLLWPAHGAGSACGKNLGAVPVSSLGYERKANWGLRFESEDAFTSAVLEGQPEPPHYFKEMKRINRDGPPILGGIRVPSRLAGSMIHCLLDQDVVLLDVRPSEIAAQGAVPNALNVSLGKSFITWSGWLIPYDKPIYLIADDENDALEAVRDLHKIGLDDVQGWFGADVLEAWSSIYGPAPSTPQIDARSMAKRHASGSAKVIDVRGAVEYASGHIPGVENIPLGYLEAQSPRLLKEKPIIVHCQGGSRSAIAVSVLRRLGFSDVTDAAGGFMEYEEAALPVESGFMAKVGT